MLKEWAPCEPLRETPTETMDQDKVYKTWNETRREEG
jgi:hypothetical protein